MELNFYTEVRYIRGMDGKIYSPRDVSKYQFYKKYLSVYKKVNVIARVEINDHYVGKDTDLVEGEGVVVVPIQYYIGPLQYFKKRRIIESEIKNTISTNKIHILRVPGRIGSIAYKFLSKYKMSYGVEVVGDPFEVFSKNGVKHPLRLFFKYYESYLLKKIVFEAKSALYVTKETLQKKYGNKNSYCASDVVISKVSLKTKDYHSFLNGNFLKLISIGSLEQFYKGPDIIVKAMKVLKDKGIFAQLTWIGEGKYKNEILDLAKQYDVKVEILGYIADRDKINYYLDQSDIFIIASRTEGLPRVIVEAFSRSLPVLGSKVGGIPELVSEEYLFKSEHYIELASLIKDILDKDILFNIGTKNLLKANDYTWEKLQVERENFYKSLIS